MSNKNLIYVLDDDLEVASLVCHFVSSAGMLARSFDKPLAFLEAIKAEQPGLVVLDISLGKSDAIEVIRKLSQVGYNGRLLIISGLSETILREVHEIGVSHGIAMVPPLRKPFQRNQFRERLSAEPETKAPPSNHSIARLDIDLREAITNHYLELWYQPKIDLGSLSICGGEALIRLRHPQHGVLSPADFLPPPNDPLSEPISIFVLSTAMGHLKLLLDLKMQTKLSVNMPVSIVTQPGFISNIRMGLPQSEHSSFIVEVTEDEVIEDTNVIREVATQLKILNVGVSIDDFGIGHASLARLHELPCVEIKLDRKFVLNSSTDRLKHGICQTVVDLARRFDVSVCAEGVETAEDLKAIMHMGFDTAQGFLFAKPMPFESFVKALLRNTTDSAMSEVRMLRNAPQVQRVSVNANAAQVARAYEQQKKLG